MTYYTNERRADGPVLVTGAAGFVGLPLVGRLRTADLDVVAIDNGAAGTLHRLAVFRHDQRVRVRELDLRDGEAIAQLMARERPQAVIHLAARHFIPACDQDPAETLAVNVVGTQNLLAGCRTWTPRKIVLTSTAAVYSPADAPLREDSPVGPEGVYGYSKIAAEQLVREQFGAKPGCDVVVARLFNVYGPGDPNPHLIPEIVGQTHHGDLLRLGDLTAARDFIYLDDTVDALFALTAMTVSGTYNVGAGVATTGHDVVDLMGRLIGRRFEVHVDRDRLRTSDRPYVCADVSRLRRLLPWWPRTGLAEGLSALLAADHETPTCVLATGR